jgi:hypothetical protein
MYDEARITAKLAELARITAKLAELGVAPAEEGGKKALYLENWKPDDMLAEIICRESLRSGLASSATAFVAIRSQAGKSVERSVVVPNAMPQGWEMGQPMAVMASSPAVLRSPVMFRDEDVESTPVMRCFQEGVFESMRTMPRKQRGAVRPDHVTLFDGVPAGSGRVVLVECTVGAGGPQGLFAAQLTGLAAAGDSAAFPPDAVLLLYVGDMARARARVQLADLLHGAVRPLNIICADGQVVRLVLMSSTATSGHLTVTVDIA